MSVLGQNSDPLGFWMLAGAKVECVEERAAFADTAHTDSEGASA